MSKWLEVQSQAGEPIDVDGVILTPRAQAVVMRWPGGGFVWNRPTAVDVQEAGVTTRLPIVDVTRLVLILLLLLPILLTGILTWINWYGNKRSHEWIRI